MMVKKPRNEQSTHNKNINTWQILIFDKMAIKPIKEQVSYIKIKNQHETTKKFHWNYLLK